MLPTGRTVLPVARRPGRPGRSHGLPLPHRDDALLGAAALLATALTVGGLIWFERSRAVPAYEPRDDAAALSEPGGATVSAPPAAPVLAFYGDWFVSGTAEGGIGDAGWPAIVSQRIGADGSAPHAVADAGYVAVSAVTADTFTSLVERAPEPTADVTIVFGGRNDYRAPPEDIAAAATRTFGTIQADAPGTELLVIGPAWSGSDVPPDLLPVRDAVQQAAAGAEATFVDPLAEQWFAEGTGLVAADLISPTDAGHVVLADRIEPVLRQLLTEDLPGSGDQREAVRRTCGSGPLAQRNRRRRGVP